MKYLILFITPLFIYAQSYMAKVQPYEKYTIYAQTSGQIIKLDKNDETKVVSKVLIKLDDSLEKEKLKLYQKQLEIYNEKLKIQKENFKKFIKISGKSKSDKDDKFYDILDLKVSIESLRLSIAELKDTINKKSIAVKNLYIKEFDVDNGDYVAIGAELATAYDTTKSKLVVYVSSDDYKDIKNKKVYVDGKTDIAKIEKIDETVDDTYVSAHKVTLTLDNKEFGKVLNVEFKK